MDDDLVSIVSLDCSLTLRPQEDDVSVAFDRENANLARYFEQVEI